MSQSKEYWSGRELQKLKGQLKNVKKLEKFSKRQYEIALKEINSEIATLFLRYADDNNLSYKDATKLLSGKEFNEWKMSLKEYIDLIEKTGDEALLLELNTLAMKSRISRLEEMFYQIDKKINTLYNGLYDGTKSLLKGAVKDSYYRSVFNVQKFIGVGKPFARISETSINEVLSYPWSGANYSSRIWGNRSKAKNIIRQEMTQMIIQGKGSKEVAKALADRMEVDYKNAIRLINTEHAYIMGEASARGYEETDVEQYEILATLDIKTSKVCQKEDGEVYNLKDKKVGLNYPPFHPHCRTTTIPYFEDDEEDGKRTARNPGGKTYEVPGDMKYEDWYSKHVDNSAKDEIAATKISTNRKGKPERKDFTTKKDIHLKINNKESKYYIKQGSKVTKVEVIAGKGVKRQIDDIDRIVNTYRNSKGELTKKSDWQKVKGLASITDGNNEEIREVHWYEGNGIGKVEWKIKVRGGSSES